jgi:hypothetical protein
MDREERRTEVIGLLERDYQSARDLMSSANGSIDRTRTFGFALVAALIGFTAANHTLWLGLLAALACGLLAYLDGFQSWRYQEAVKHALRIERIQQLLYRAHTASFSERDEKSLSVRTAAFRPGVLTGQGDFTRSDIRHHLPKPILILYLLLAGAGIGIGIYANTTGSTTTVNARVLPSSEKHEHPPADLTVVVRDAMTGAQRAQLAKLAGEMRHSRRPSSDALGAAITALLNGTPGAAATVFSALAKQGGRVEQQAGDMISKALADAAVAAARAGGGTTTTVNNDQSHFSLNSPSFVFNAAPPSTSTKEKETHGGSGEQHGDGGTANGGTPGPRAHDETTSRSKTFPVTP